MNPLEFLRQFPGHAEFSRASLVLLFVYFLRKHAGMAEAATRDITRVFKEAMLRVPTDMSAIVRALSTGRNSPLLRTRAGAYALSIHGVAEVESITPAAAPSTVEMRSFLDIAVPHLQRVIAKVTDPQRKDFLAESISCLGVGARRATVVLTWVAALDHLHEYVLTHHLDNFNAALGRRSDRLSRFVVTTRDDFGEMKESVFIEVCRSANTITADVRKMLDEKLGFRNSCAHPSSISIGDSKVVSFIEDLVDNVIAKFKI